MQNAHLRLGLLEYQRFTEKISTRIRVRVDRYVGEDRKAHLLSVFGNDSDIGTITAAVHENATFTLTFPDGTHKEVTLERTPPVTRGRSTSRIGSISCATWLRPHKSFMPMGTSAAPFLLRYQRAEAWAILVSFLGRPGEPTWADHVLGVMEKKERIKDIDGIGCRPVLLSDTTEELLDWIGDGLRSEVLRFPEENGPIAWPLFELDDVLPLIRCE